MSYDKIKLNISKGWKKIASACKVKEFLENDLDIVMEFHRRVKEANGSMLEDAVKSAMSSFVEPIRTPFLLPENYWPFQSFMKLRNEVYPDVLEQCGDELETVKIILGSIILVLREKKAKVDE